jgi:hypothetical protein
MGHGSVQDRIAAVRAAHERGEIGSDELSAQIDGLLDEVLTGGRADGGGALT